MNHIRLMLTVSALLSITCINANIIEDAIKDSDLETLRILVTVGTTHNHSFTVTKAEKATYSELAQAQVQKCKEKATNSTSFDAVTALDWLAILGFAAGTVSGSILVYKHITAEGKDKWTEILGFGTFCYGLSNVIKSGKDFVKNLTEHRCKSKEALKKAENVAKLVEAMPVEG